jgi:glycolate oxidase iron-sulfur subunit
MKIEPFIGLSESQSQQATTILRSCVHCGLCNATCPTYQLLSNELDGPRGRIYLIKQVLEGAKVSEKTQLHLDRCLTCRACETTCPSGVDYGRLLDLGRAQVEKQVQRPVLERFKRTALRKILPYPKRFSTLLTLARCTQPFLPEKLAKLIPQSSKTHENLNYSVIPQQRWMLVLEGCVQSSLAPQINQAAAKVLQQLGISLITAPTTGCCGALSYHLTAVDESLDFARRNIDAWLPYLEKGVENIVMTASGCGVMVKDYAELLKEDVNYAQKARRISAATRDIVEIIQAEDLSLLKLTQSEKIAVQCPCTLQHGQKLAGAMEAVLQRLGFSVNPVADAHVCCGSAGTYSVLQAELSEQLGQNKIAALEKSQPNVIATANIGCLKHLETKTQIPVQHWIEIVAAALSESSEKTSSQALTDSKYE